MKQKQWDGSWSDDYVEGVFKVSDTLFEVHAVDGKTCLLDLTKTPMPKGTVVEKFIGLFTSLRRKS